MIWQDLPKENKIIRIVLICFVVFFVLFLAGNYFIVSGKKHIVYDFDEKNPYISLFNPLDRVSEIICDDYCYQQLIAEPVYFKLLTGVNINQADILLQYKSIDQPIIEMGVKVGESDSAIDLYPVQNKILEKMINEPKWHAVSEGNIYLLQKQKKYDSVDDFLQDIDYEKKIAVYDYDLDYDFKIQNYQADSIKHSYDLYSLGNIGFLTYIENEDLNFDLEFADFDNNENFAVIKITDENDELIYEKTVDQTFVEEIKIAGLNNGVYRLQVVADDSFVLKNLQTTNQKLIIDHQVNLMSATDILKNFPQEQIVAENFYTVSRRISFMAGNEGGLQNIDIDNQKMPVEQRMSWHEFSSDLFAEHFLKITKRGVLINSDGYLAFDKDSYFNPKPYNFRAITVPGQADFDYILAHYEFPEELDDGWQEKTVTLDLSKAFYEDRQVEMLFSLPQIEKNNGQVLLRKMKFILQK